jgi:hypothetical protein
MNLSVVGLSLPAPLSAVMSEPDDGMSISFVTSYLSTGPTTHQLAATIDGHEVATPRFRINDYYGGAGGYIATSPWEVVTPADLTLLAGRHQENYDLNATTPVYVRYAPP